VPKEIAGNLGGLAKEGGAVGWSWDSLKGSASQGKDYPGLRKVEGAATA